MTSVNDDNVPATISEDVLTDGKFLIADDTIVEPLEIDGQRPGAPLVSLQMFTEVPPHGLQGTILTLKETEPSGAVFESYLASKSTRVKGGPPEANLLPGQSSSSSQLQPCFVGSNVIPQKVVLTMPTSGVVDPQRGGGQVGLRSVRPQLGNQFAATNSTLSAARKVRSACDLALQGQVPVSRVVTLVGKSGETRQNIRQVGDATILKVPIQAALQPKSGQSISGMLKNYGLQPSGTGGKVSRTPNIFSRRGCAKKPPNASQPLSLTASSPISPTLHASPVFQVTMTMAHAVAKPKVTSTFVRSQLVAGNSQGLVVKNPPGTVTSAAIIPSVSSFGFDAANNSKLLRFASPRNVSLAPISTLTLSGASPRVAAGAVRFPAPSLAGSTASLPRPVLGSSIARALIPQMGHAPQRTMSPLTSFRMQNVRNTLKTGSGVSSGQNAIPQVPAATERLSLKRKAPAIEEGRPAKRRRLLSGRVYSIDLPDGKKVTGVWDNGMVRSLASPTPSDGKIVDNSSVEKDAGQVGAQLNDDGACSNAGGDGCKSTSSADVKLKTMMDSAEGGASRFYICMSCKTVRIQNVPCVTCNTMPQPCIYRSGPEKTNKLPAAAAAVTATNTAHLQTHTDVMLQQVAVNAGQPKALNRIVMMQGPASRQFHLTRRPVDQTATSSPAVRLGLPIQLHPTIAALGTGIQRTPTPRIMRKKTSVQKRPEPDVVQILSSDDEDSHALESGNGSQTGALPSVSSSSVTAQPSVTTQETQETCPEPMNTIEAPASIENHLFTIKIRLVRFGTLQKATVVESSFYVDGIKIVFFKDDVIDSSSLYIPVADLRVVRVHYGPCGPVFFLHATAGVAVRLREIFRMSVQGHIFDPEHKDDACRFITIIPDKNQVVAEAFVTAMIEKMQGSCLAGHKFTVQTINGEVASQLLKAKLSTPVTEVSTMNINATQKVIFITANGQIIQRHIVGAELAGQTLMVRPMEGEEEEELADRSRSPSPPHPTFIGPIVRLFTYPPPPATGGIAVTNEDFFCLKDGEYLNDVIIDFYLKYLLREVLNREDRERTHVFSSFFYRRLMQKQAGKHSDEANMTLQQLRHSRVRTWTRHVDLFSKDFIIVPINESAHWYLAIICFPGLGGIISADSKQQDTNLAAGDGGGGGDMDTSNPAGENSGATEETQTASQDNSRMETDCPKEKDKKPCILIFDSLAMPTRYGVVRTLREYLQTEWDVKKKTREGLRNFNKDNMQGACPRCPRQTNYSDCGVYVLQYVESFFKDPIPDFTLPITTLANWFSEEVIVSKRDSLRQLVLRLQKGLNPELEYDPCQNSVDSLTSGSNLQLMSASSANTTVAAEKLPSDSASNSTPVVSGISESPENCASDKQKNGDLGAESSTCADSLASADVSTTEPASSNHSVVAPSSSSSSQENLISNVSQTAVTDSKDDVCNDYTPNPEDSTAPNELERATVSNEEQPSTDCTEEQQPSTDCTEEQPSTDCTEEQQPSIGCTDTNSAMRKTGLDIATTTVDCQEFSALKLSDENNVKASEAGGATVSIPCHQQQPLPVNVGKTASKETSYVDVFSSWLSKRSHKSAPEDCSESVNAATPLSESCATEEEQISLAAGQKMDTENRCHPSQNASCSEKMDLDSELATGVSASSVPSENSTIPLRDEHLETGQLSTLSSPVEQSSQNEVELAASSCTNNVLNAVCTAVNDQMTLEDGQV